MSLVIAGWTLEKTSAKKDPIGGSTNAQTDWANQVNPLREIAVGRAVYLRVKGIDAAVSYGIGKTADAIALPSNEK